MPTSSGPWRSLCRYPRFDRDHPEALLAPGFFEFGRSERVWTRADVLATPAHDLHATIPLPDLVVRMLISDIAPLTYCSEQTVDGARSVANRSSIWRRVGGRWQLEFHQGTPADADSFG